MTLEISVLCCVCYAQSLQSSLALCNSMDCRDQWIGFKSCYQSMYFLCCMRTGVSWIIESAWIFEFFIASVSRSHLTQSFFFPCSILLFLACFLFLKVTFNWRIIALQNRVGFCHVSTWVSHRYTYVASLLKLPLTPSHPSRLSQSTGLNSQSHVVNFCWLSVLHMVTYMFPAVLSVHPTVLPTLCPQVCSLCLSPMLPCKQVHQSHLSRLYMYVFIHNCLSDFV